MFVILRTTNNQKQNEKFISEIIQVFGNEKNKMRLSQYVEMLLYYKLILDRPLTPTSITGRIRPVVNNNEIKKNENAEYVKLKYSPLGIRFIDNKPGKLIISSPKEKQGAFKKIKRENFSWNISKYSV